MNLLFANYGDFTTNSLNHIGAFANQLTLSGHACAVAVPEGLETIGVVPEVRFKPVTFGAALALEPIFPDRRPADVLHVWTPREITREFSLAYLRRHPGTTLLIHLEDNEPLLAESFAHLPLAELRELSDEDLLARLTPRLSHPVRHRNFLRLAHGATCITDRLREHVPAGKPVHRLLPGTDPSLYRPLPPDPALRASLGIQPNQKLIVYTGSTNFANLADVRSLHLAVSLLNRRGTACKLLRTGINPPVLAAELSAAGGEHVIDLGFVDKARLAPLLALADVLVQPGAPDAFNDYRLPSKLPEFLAMGRPVITPCANIAQEMEAGRHALLLTTGSAEEIAGQCQRVFADAQLADRLSAGAVEFARSRFDLAANTAALAAFYDQVRAIAAPFSVVSDLDASEDVLLADGDTARRMLAKERSLAHLRRHLAAVESAHAAARAEVDTLGRSLASLRIEHASVVTQAASLGGELQAGRENASILNTRVTALQAEATRLASLEGAHQSELASLRTAHATLLSESAKLAARETALQAELAALQATHAKLTEHAAALATRGNALQTEFTDLRATHATLASAFARVAATLEAEQQQSTGLQSELAALQRAHSELSAEASREGSALREERAKTAAQLSELATLRSQRSELAARLSYHSTKLEAGRRDNETLHRQLATAAEGMARLVQDLDAAQSSARQATEEARLSEERMQRMARSFSWQVTSPLRWLRRKFLDPRQPAGPRPPAAPDANISCTVDQPGDWLELPPQGAVSGWMIARDGRALTKVRLHVSDRIFEGVYGTTRPDVAAALPSFPHAPRSGFSIDYSLPPGGPHPVTIEVMVEGGQWVCASSHTAHVAAETPEHLRRDYASWVRRFDTLTPVAISSYHSRLEDLRPAQRPLISILLPSYNTPEPWLSKAIESVRAQLYPHWELCIADDASTAPHVRAVLEEFARRDTRIKLTLRTENGHICAASNSALALATGEFTALLDHDDELPPHALAEVVLALAANPALEFIYTDEDKIDDRGRRSDPYFKPDWNPDLLLGQNYTCHLSVFRTERLRQIGGFRPGYEGSQDWDLTLRVTEGLPAEKIHHIPRILYHWRAIPGSTALIIDQKNDYPFVAAQKALRDHLARTGVAAELVAVSGRHWRMQRPLPPTPPKVSIIIPTRNAERLLRLSVGSILAKSTYPDFEVIVVNNRSDDPATFAYFDELRAAGVRVLDYDAPFNFSAINNFAAREARGTLLAFLNNDLEVITPGWLEEMAAQALRPEIGAVGAMLYYPNDTVQHAGVILGLTGPARRDGVAGHAFKCAPRDTEDQRNRLRLVQNYSAVTAACLVLRREVFEAVGGYNEPDLAVAFNDIDLCLRVRAAGYRNLWTPFAEFYHHESASRGAEDTPEKIARFQRETAYMRNRWASLLDRDPAYNLNLSLEHEDFSLSFPPRL